MISETSAMSFYLFGPYDNILRIENRYFCTLSNVMKKCSVAEYYQIYSGNFKTKSIQSLKDVYTHSLSGPILVCSIAHFVQYSVKTVPY